MSKKERHNRLMQRASFLRNRILGFEDDLKKEPRWRCRVMIVAALKCLLVQAEMVGQEIRRMA